MFGISDPTGRNLFGRDETGVANRLREVITTEPRWVALWREANGPNGPDDLPAAPAVAFGREAVVVASLGEHANRGWRIAIAGAALRRDTLFVVVRTDAGVPGCHRNDNLVSPVAVARVSRAGWRSVHFVEVARDLKQCG